MHTMTPTEWATDHGNALTLDPTITTGIVLQRCDDCRTRAAASITWTHLTGRIPATLTDPEDYEHADDITSYACTDCLETITLRIADTPHTIPVTITIDPNVLPLDQDTAA